VASALLTGGGLAALGVLAAFADLRGDLGGELVVAVAVAGVLAWPP
jgi:hypothetical protein